MTRWTIIRASAGSGKTYRLTELLTDRLTHAGDDGTVLRPSQIIATTFTRAAAAELTDRIRGTLVDRGLLDQAAALPTALIGTVNSVTGRILTDFALDAGRSPDLAVLTEQSQHAAFTRATDHLIADAEDAHRALLARTGYDAVEDRGFFSRATNWAATIRSVTDHARSNNIAAGELPGFAEASIAELHAVLDEESAGSAPTDTRAALATAARSLPRRLRDEIDDGTIPTRSANGVLDRIDALERFGRRVRRDRDSIPWSDWLKTAEGKVPGVPSPTKPIKEAYGSVTSAAEILADPALRGDVDTLIRLVFTTAAECLSAYADYKDALGLIDFTDQEQLTLQLLRGEGVPEATRQAVRETLAARFRILVVDEFQDTSPLQLALFTELAQLVDEVIWVGDPKQSIYGFRGSDPALMDSAVEVITDPAGLAGRSEVLTHSYRTRQAPLDLSNRLFSRLFTGDVELTVPEARACAYAADGARAAGETVTWPHTEGRAKKELWFDRIVDGIAELDDRDAHRGSRAILVRTNTHAAEIRSALGAAGIPCAGGGVPLSTTREGQLVTAALALLLDTSDTRALVELITLMPDHPAHADWFDQLTALPDRDACRAQLREWAADPVLAPLTALRGAMSELPVTELVTAVVDALDLRGRVAASTGPAQRTGSVTGILQAAADFAAEQESAGEPATVAGVLAHLADEGTVSTPTAEPGAVEVHTVHQAKGLEWDTVVVALPDARERFTPAGVWVQSNTPLTMSDPLAGRHLRFWPDTLLAHSGVKKALTATDAQQSRRTTELLEEQRLLYVAMTRSRFRTVLAPYSSTAKWRALAESGLAAGELAELLADSDPVPALPRETEKPAELAETATDATGSISPAGQLDVDRGVADSGCEIVSATFAPSGAEASAELAAGALVREVADLGPALVSGGGPEWNKVGDCIHSYLAAPLDSLDDAVKQQVAARLVTNWGVGAVVTAEQVVECGERWQRFLHESLGATAVDSEVPFTWANADHQRAQGWIDQLVTVAGGGDSGDDRQIIVDHKTYPGGDPVGHVRKNYLGQMDVYRQALTDITGTAPARILIHLPLLGSVVEVELP
ncbi:exodeoxyribonuclease V subunit beta [uncultured Corynebacterium sp.]|uniref:UvrD-helicase domain-containing protein n=1 Tax=uncultured Corynebacterium sp. TaxID=159447 RepID=UPI0025D0348A|nr:UvrD-helicase domain-containing protein [uncultured Corynebacterium sp.]